LVLVTHHIHEIPPDVSRVILLHQGQVWADGDKRELLSADNLTALFETKVRLVESAGWYQVVPA
jgi:iron complex transport system ATP-binding protein